MRGFVGNREDPQDQDSVNQLDLDDNEGQEAEEGDNPQNPGTNEVR